MNRPPLDLQPRARIVSLSRQEATGLLRMANLGDDPFDPKQALAFASHGLLTWLAAEQEDRANEPGAPPLSDVPEVRGDWPQELRAGWIMPMNYAGRRLALVVVTRRHGSPVAAPHVVSRQWLSGQQVEALCVSYVQVGGKPNESVVVLMEGWLDAEQLARLSQQPARNGSALVRIEPASLRPMGELYDLLKQPALRRAVAPPDVVPAPPTGAVTPSPPPAPPAKPWFLLGLTLVSTAVALLLAVLLFTRKGPILDRGEVAASVIEADFKPILFGRGGSDVPIVFDDQKFSMRVRVAAAPSRSFGWLFWVDRRGVTHLKDLSRQPDGTLGASYDGKVSRDKGWEYAVIVVADRELPRDRLEDWLNDADLAALQKAGTKGDEAALKVVRTALLRAGLDEGRFDVKIQRIQHE